MRPLLVVNKSTGNLLLSSSSMEEEEEISWNSLLESGCMELVDCYEQEGLMIAPTAKDLEKRIGSKFHYIIGIPGGGDQLVQRSYTHCELAPQAVLGVTAALTPLANHNQAPRNVFQANMCKQALASDPLRRAPKSLVFPSDPLLYTSAYNMLDLNGTGPGNTLMVSLHALPQTEEDSFIFKEDFLNRGGMLMRKRMVYQTTLTVCSDKSEETYRFGGRSYAHLDANGLPKIGSFLKMNQVVIGKRQCRGSKNVSVQLKPGDEGVVVEVRRSHLLSATKITVVLELARSPGYGDKFSPRNAQKGTIGEIVPKYNMPVIMSEGFGPDMIMNTLSIASRMTVTQPLFMEIGTMVQRKGSFAQADAFMGSELKSKYLRVKRKSQYQMSWSPSCPIGKVTCGPVFIQSTLWTRCRAGGFGLMTADTRQATKGKSNKGGIRFGEMERDAITSSGAPEVVRERTQHSSHDS